MSLPFCTDQVLILASGIYQNIGSPPNISVGFISGWITNSGTLGDINNRLGTCTYMSGDSPCLVDFDQGRGSILSLIYQTSYFQNAALAVLAAGGVPWLSMSEGDSKVTRESRTSIAKAYQSAQNTAQSNLQFAINYWTLNQSVPQGIDGVSLYSWPTP